MGERRSDTESSARSCRLLGLGERIEMLETIGDLSRDKVHRGEFGLPEGREKGFISRCAIPVAPHQTSDCRSIDRCPGKMSSTPFFVLRVLRLGRLNKTVSKEPTIGYCMRTLQQLPCSTGRSSYRRNREAFIDVLAWIDNGKLHHRHL